MAEKKSISNPLDKLGGGGGRTIFYLYQNFQLQNVQITFLTKMSYIPDNIIQNF